MADTFVHDQLARSDYPASTRRFASVGKIIKEEGTLEHNDELARLYLGKPDVERLAFEEILPLDKYGLFVSVRDGSNRGLP